MSAPATSASVARDGVSFHVSPMLLASGVAAIISTILLAVLWYLDARPPPPRVPGPPAPPPPPPQHLAFLVVLGIFTVAWVAVIASICRDQIIRHLNDVAQRVTTATLEFGEHRETEGYLLAMRNAEAERGPTGGSVLPFPRPPEPPERTP